MWRWRGLHRRLRRVAEVERLAFVDVLAGLFNRHKIESHLERQIKEGRSSSVIYFDLNGFKKINDTLVTWRVMTF